MFVWIVALPLIASIVAGLFHRVIGTVAAQWVTCGAVIGSTILGGILFFRLFHGEAVPPLVLFDWVTVGSFQAVWSLRLDMLTAVMVLVVTVVSSCVHVYSIGYMSHDANRARFMSYLSLFTFAMLMLVTANDFVQLFFGWEGVGVASYLLIGFWSDRDSANKAAIKAFVVNRVGDFGFALGIFGVYLLFGSVQFETVFAAVPSKLDAVITIFGHEWPTLTVICLLLFIGAMGKSAQIGLHTWLPDAMEGPTPVSALIHAATMVTAGVFMLVRFSPLFEYAEGARLLVAMVGAATCFFAATVALTQFDIKRVIAYSTCSQLGYMVFAAGVSAYDASMFHLVTHAAFKALLFLGAGSVIHALVDEQDMRRMGGLWRVIPFTYVLMLIGSLALAGIPPFAGYASKHMMLEADWAFGGWEGHLLYVVGTIVAFMTAFYSFRLVFLVFHGKPRADQHKMDHAHESPFVMLLPLIVLAIGSLSLGVIGEYWLVGEGRMEFWGSSVFVHEANDSIAKVEQGGVPELLKLLPSIAGVSGILLAVLLYLVKPLWPAAIVKASGGIYRFVHNKWYFDEVYDFLFVRPAMALGKILWQKGDIQGIDRFGPDGISLVTRLVARRATLLQSGYIYHYAFAMVIGLVVLVSWYMLRPHF